QHVLKAHVWRWLLLFIPLSLGMFVAQRMLFPASPHLELPGRNASNPWVQAFLWAKENTPQDAIFALDPHYMDLAGEDENGFRAIAERSRMADIVKDSGAVTMFPPLAEQWLQQVRAEEGWTRFGLQDFMRLRQKFGVTWLVLAQPGVPG